MCTGCVSVVILVCVCVCVCMCVCVCLFCMYLCVCLSRAYVSDNSFNVIINNVLLLLCEIYIIKLSIITI